MGGAAGEGEPEGGAEGTTEGEGEGEGSVLSVHTADQDGRGNRGQPPIYAFSVCPISVSWADRLAGGAVGDRACVRAC